MGEEQETGFIGAGLFWKVINDLKNRIANIVTGGGVQSLSGNIVDNTDPNNPVVSQVQSDWNQSDDTQIDFIKNKPEPPAPFILSDTRDSLIAGLSGYGLGLQGFANDVMRGVLLTVIADEYGNESFSKTGTVGMLDCDYQGIGDYSNLTAYCNSQGSPGIVFNQQKGIWNTVKATADVDPSTATMTVKYNNLLGGTFSAGAATSNGNTINIVSDNGVDEMVISNFSGALVTGVIAQGGVTADLTDKYIFSAGETVTGGTSGATAKITTKVDDTTSVITSNTINGTFVFETITGSGGNVEDFIAGGDNVYLNVYVAGDVACEQAGGTTPLPRPLMFVNLTGTITSTTPSLDPTNWLPLDLNDITYKAETLGYIYQSRSCDYDIVQDVFQKITMIDSNTTEVVVSGDGTCRIFPFGYSGIRESSFGAVVNLQIYSPITNIIQYTNGPVSSLIIPDLSTGFVSKVCNHGQIEGNLGNLQNITVGYDSTCIDNTGTLLNVTIGNNSDNSRNGTQLNVTLQDNVTNTDNTDQSYFFGLSGSGCVGNNILTGVQNAYQIYINTGTVFGTTNSEIIQGNSGTIYGVNNFGTFQNNVGDIYYTTNGINSSIINCGDITGCDLGNNGNIDGDGANHYKLEWCETAPGSTANLTTDHIGERLSYTTGLWTPN